MTFQDALARGAVSEAIDLAVAAVRERPRDHDARFALVDLLSFSGDWARAEKQTALLAEAPEADVYRLLIRAGRERAAFFAEGSPSHAWVIEPPAWAAAHLAGCELFRKGDIAGARELFDAAGEGMSLIRGEICGEAFNGFRDLDDRLGPVLELVGPGGYCWIPWEDVRFLDVATPETWRDMIWIPARVALAQGPIGRVYLPTTYPGSETASGPLQLGRETDWVDAGHGLASGLGLKVALAGERSFGLFDLRDVRFLSERTTEAGRP